MRLPKTPEQRRADKAARQKRWRDNQKRKEQVAAAVDGAMGLGPAAPLPEMPEKDLAVLVRDRIHRLVTEMPDMMLMDKDIMPTIKTGLQAEKIIDTRKAQQAKTGGAELAFALIKWLAGGDAVPAKQLEDGNTIEGTYVEAE